MGLTGRTGRTGRTGWTARTGFTEGTLGTELGFFCSTQGIFTHFSILWRKNRLIL